MTTSSLNLMDSHRSFTCNLKAADLQNILENQIFQNISSNIHALKTDNSLLCHRDIPTIHNGYCVSKAVDYSKINDVLPTSLSTFSLELMGQ